MVLECHTAPILWGACIVTGGLGFGDLAVGGCDYWGCWFGKFSVSLVNEFSTGVVFPSAGWVASLGTPLWLGYGPNFVGGLARSVPSGVGGGTFYRNLG